MVSLQTSYAGLSLDNPIVVGSSGLVDNPDKVRRMADFGPGAIVLKSLFEEQILADSGRITEVNAYPEALDYIRNYSKSHTVGKYLDLIGDARKTVHLPIIASINCISGSVWTGFARQIEEAGADALELNIFILPVDDLESARIEKKYFEVLDQVKAKTRLPLIVKISPYFTNLVYMVHQFYAHGAQAVVLFNRLYEPDIDLAENHVTSHDVFSNPADLRQSLRWISLISDKDRKIDLSASTGVHDPAAVIKLLLAGASTVQVCSVLYKNGPEYLQILLNGLENWMQKKGYNNIDDFRGLLNYRSHEDPATWERVQFMRYYSERH
ncbi:MAG: dihydroorotate dehydrogenase-like protein [Bacteroidota bacterium]